MLKEMSEPERQFCYFVFIRQSFKSKAPLFPIVFYSAADVYTNFISRFILNCPCLIQSFP